MLNVPRLRVLYELSRRGSVSAVADALWITPSAVSQQLAALERETGAQLVQRSGRTVRPTDAGRRLASEAARVLQALDIAEAAARDLVAEQPAPLRVAAFPSVVLGVLAPALRRFRDAHPDVLVDVIDVEGAAGLDLVRLGRAQVAVIDDWGWDLGTDREGLVVEPLLSDPLLAVLPTSNPLAGAEVVRWTDLAQADWVMEPGETLFTQRITGHCRKAGFEPTIRARVRDFAVQAALVRALGLVTVLPATATTPAEGIAVRRLQPDLRRHLLTVSQQPPGPSAAHLLDALRRSTTAQPSRENEG